MVSAPTPTFTPDNLSKSPEELKDLNFKVSPDLHRDFKLTATAWGMSMKELLEAAYKGWVEKHGKFPGE
ncbi:hypothetical protein SAMN05216548_11432 [Faunimonas pinastri]|uniref:Uncharacterized protein n=2 Tax=Faunimonas pinastri TaxID=1855383 RepID=A0A1H9MU92_9HYPH|nr:hypothetical protein SAMN05216548_11432 [Faunimonas pinastri]